MGSKEFYEKYVDAAKRMADALRKLSERDGVLAGYYNEQWAPISHAKCLTGLAQTSITWLKLYKMTGNRSYLQQALSTNSFLKSVHDVESKHRNLKGAVAGSYSIWGKYMPFNYINWAAKFFVDALLLENDIHAINKKTAKKEETA